MKSSSSSIWSVLGPGFLYAGAAIGVSHLVQSTQAGAMFGYSLIVVVVLANVLKYPFFEFSSRYVAVTGKNLLHGYKNLGKWAIWTFILLSIGTMFFIQSAVTLVTAGIAASVFGGFGLTSWALIILISCVIILAIGNYNFLDKIMKVIIVLLTVTTLVCLFFALNSTSPVISTDIEVVSFSLKNTAHIGFLIALMGWMPSPIDISVWHSVWSTTKFKNQKQSLKTRMKNGALDFNIGYWGTAILAVCFLLLGALTLYGTGVTVERSAVKFANQLIGMYTQSLGDWAYYLIAIAALTTMFSTTLTCLDAFPRVLVPAFQLLKSDQEEEKKSTKSYWLWTGLVILGSMIILQNFINDMAQMIFVATVISFITAPILAWLNLKCVTSKSFPLEHHPPILLKILSYVGLTFLISVSLYFLYSKLS